MIGPIWTGNLHSKSIVKNVKQITEKKQLNTKKRMMKHFDVFEDEADAPLWYYTTNDVASILRMSPPRLDRLFTRFNDEGIPIFRTQFDPTGFKTSASLDAVKEIFLDVIKSDEENDSETQT